MKLCILLVQKQFRALLRTNLMFCGSKKEKRNYMALVFCLAAGLGTAGYYWVRYMTEMTELIADRKVLWNTLVLADIVMVFFSSLVKGSGIVFADRTIEMEFSFPIPEKRIALSKLIFVYLWEFLLTLALFAVPLYRYEAAGLNLLYCAVDTIRLLIFPVLPMLAGLLMGRILYRQFNRRVLSVSYVRNIASVLLLSAFLFAMFFRFADIDAGQTQKSGFFNFEIMTLPDVFFAYSVYGAWCTAGVLAASAGLGFYILSTYKKTCQKNVCVPTGRFRDRREYRPEPLAAALLQRELRRYFATPAYLLNTMVGIILTVLFTVYSLIHPDTAAACLAAVGSIFHIGEPSILCAFILSILIGLSNVSYASISIEGEGHEILKSYPLSLKSVILVKYAFHLTLTLPVVVICSGVLGICFGMTFHERVLCLLLPAAVSAFTGTLGLCFNLLMPDYDWKNAAYIVKQSPPALLTIIVSFAVILGMIWLLLHTGENIIGFTYLSAALILTAAAAATGRLCRKRNW